MSKLSHKKLPEGQPSSNYDIVSDAELETVLNDVETMQADKEKLQKETNVRFTKEDERNLEQIFDDAERRRNDFKDVRGAALHNDEVSDDDDRSSEASSSSQSSQDSGLDELIDAMETAEDSKEIPKLNEAMEGEMDQILAEVEGWKLEKK
ncbi:hypothetical protein QZH41_007270 [Actinostola sp. cb2023]|nr:hypothetical protein QZH41_007270 [Actinostola sp. cb2023]